MLCESGLSKFHSDGVSMSVIRSFVGFTALLVTLFAARSSAAHTAFAKLYDFWRYDASGNDLGSAWQDPAFDDSAWALGETPLGAGGGINYKTQIPISQTTTYLRRSFDLDASPGSITKITVSAVYAHGFVLY